MAGILRSKSSVLLVAVLAAAAALGVATSLPLVSSALRSDMVDVQPGMLTVEPAARGLVTLGAGITVSLYPSGLAVQHDGQPRPSFLTVQTASLLSAGFGRLVASGDHQREEVTATLDHLRVDSVRASAAGATYSGVVYGGGRTLPMTITATRADARVVLVASVPGADFVVLHVMHGIRGLGVVLGDGTVLVDRRHPGRTEIHAWSTTLRYSVP